MQSLFEKPHKEVHDNGLISHFGSYLSQMLLDFASIWIILKISEDLTKTAAQDRGPGLDNQTETAVRAQDLGQASISSALNGIYFYVLEGLRDLAS